MLCTSPPFPRGRIRVRRGGCQKRLRQTDSKHTTQNAQHTTQAIIIASTRALVAPGLAAVRIRGERGLLPAREKGTLRRYVAGP